MAGAGRKGSTPKARCSPSIKSGAKRQDGGDALVDTKREVCRRSGGARQRSADMNRGTGTTWRTAHIAYMLNTLLADRQAGTNDPLRTAKSDRASAHIRRFAFAAIGSRGSRRNQSLLISPISLTRQSRPTYNTGKGALKAAKSQQIDSEKTTDRQAEWTAIRRGARTDGYGRHGAHRAAVR